MSIVKGASGLLQVQASLITSPAYTFVVWLKSVGGEQGFGTFLRYVNAPGAYIDLWDPFPDGLRHSVNQSAGASSVTTGIAITANTWTPVVCSSTSGRSNSIQITGDSATAPGIYGVFETPSSPVLTLMAESNGVGDIPTGDKIGAVAFYAATLDQTDIDYLLGGGAFDTLPSTITPVEYWIDSTGVVKDGSNNLTSWTGQLTSAVLTPSNTVTVDDADLVPITSNSVTTIRKGETGFTQDHGLGTITAATLGGNAITIASQVAGTVTLDETSGITTSGEYDLVLDDGSSTETYTYQLNVVGVAPSNNPVQKDGAALANLTNVQVRISAGTTLSGTEYYYTGTATTDGSGNLSSIDLSATAAAIDDSVLLQIMTAAGDSITATETIGLI